MTDGQEGKVRSAHSSDAKAVFDIRNHPESRVFFHHQEPLEWDSHAEWFERQYFSGGDNQCFVLECAGRVVGYCRLDGCSAEGALLSIAVDPDFRGRGLGTVLLHETMGRLPGGMVVRAEVVACNQASCALFENCHFILDKEIDGVRHYLREI